MNSIKRMWQRGGLDRLLIIILGLTIICMGPAAFLICAVSIIPPGIPPDTIQSVNQTTSTEDSPLTPDQFIERFNQKVNGFTWERRRQGDGVIWYKGITSGEYYQKINIFTEANDERRIDSLDFFFWHPNGQPEPFTTNGLNTIDAIISLALPEWESGLVWVSQELVGMTPYDKREAVLENKVIWLEVGRGSETAILVSLTIFEDSE